MQAFIAPESSPPCPHSESQWSLNGVHVLGASCALSTHSQSGHLSLSYHMLSFLPICNSVALMSPVLTESLLGFTFVSLHSEETLMDGGLSGVLMYGLC